MSRFGTEGIYRNIEFLLVHPFVVDRWYRIKFHKVGTSARSSSDPLLCSHPTDLQNKITKVTIQALEHDGVIVIITDDDHLATCVCCMPHLLTGGAPLAHMAYGLLPFPHQHIDVAIAPLVSCCLI